MAVSGALPKKRSTWTLERVLAVSLGVFWLIDGVLQLQPAMFTSAFVSQVLALNLQNQPSIIVKIIAFGIHLFSINLFWSNLASAFVQILIGLLLVLPLRETSLRFGLWLSVAWSLIVWIFGEGFGNLATGSASFYTGAPGSVLLYLILAIVLLVALNKKSEAPLRKLPMIAGIIFLFGAALNLVPMFWTPGMLSMLAMTPVLTGPLGALGAQGTMIGNLILVDVLAGLGIFIILAPNRAVAWITIVFLFAVWWISQGFGGLGTFPGGLATDPNSAPLFVLFLLPIFFMNKFGIKKAGAAVATPGRVG
jgi:hypothetical protein